jgi:hypothetical protein
LFVTYLGQQRKKNECSRQQEKNDVESSTIKSLKLIVTLFLVSLTLSLFVISVSVIVYALPGNIGGGGSGSKAGSFGLENSPSGFERPNNNGVPDNNFGGAFSGIERSPSPNNGHSDTNLSPSSNNGSPAGLVGLQQQQQQHQVNSPSNANHLANTNECSSALACHNSPDTKVVQPSNCSPPPNSTPQTNSGVVHTNNNNDNCAAVVHPNSPDTKVVGTNGCPTNTNTHVTVNSDGTTTTGSSSSSLTVNNVQGSNDGSSSANINTIPIANAGPNQKAHSSDQVVLDGTKSSDPSGGSSRGSN